MRQQIKIQVQFCEETEYGEFSDCLIMDKSIYDSLTVEQLENLKQERINNYISFRQNPPVIEEETKEQLLLQVNDLENQKQELLSLIQEKFGE